MFSDLLEKHNISAFFTKVTAKTPERLLSDLVGVRILQGSSFQLEFKEKNSEKKIEYKALDTRTANQIVNKLKYLK